MRFKLDENIGVRAEAALSGAGHDVTTVAGQDLGGATDPAIAEAVGVPQRPPARPLGQLERVVAMDVQVAVVAKPPAGAGALASQST